MTDEQTFSGVTHHHRGATPRPNTDGRTGDDYATSGWDAVSWRTAARATLHCLTG